MSRGPAPRAWLAALAAVACASPDGGGGGPALDAASRDAPPPCGARTLELGRCVVDGGGPCTGALAEVRHFAPLAEGAPVAVVSGPQGALMLVFSARTAGIVAGDPADPGNPRNPLVELVVARDGAELAVYRGRVGFAADGDQVVAVGLFVITDGVALDGAALMVHGRLTDADGAGRCGEVGFVAAATAQILRDPAAP